MWKSVSFFQKSFHTSGNLNANAGRFLKKVMGKTSKRKKIFFEAGVLPSAHSLSQGSTEGKHSGNSKRVSVLNKLFMKYITELIADGDKYSEFLIHKVEINRVQVAPDYKSLNVFWVAKGTESDVIVEDLFEKNAGILRHELSSLRVIGNVPRINFVKDKHYAQILEVDTRLAKADFGEDHIPVELATKLKSQLELHNKLPNEVKEKIEMLEENLAQEEWIEEEMPAMPQNVLGLNHADIMQRIKKNMKKAEALHRCSVEATENIKHRTHEVTMNDNPIDFPSDKDRRKAFKEFLEKRELQRRKFKKVDKNYNPDLQFLQEEYKKRNEMNFDQFVDFDKDDDYIEEENEIK